MNRQPRQAAAAASLTNADVFSPVFLTEEERDWLLLAAASTVHPETASNGEAPTILATFDEDDAAALRLLQEALQLPVEGCGECDQMYRNDGKFGEAVKAAKAMEGSDERTTVMMRKVPRRLSHEDLLGLIDKQTPGLENQVEFLYLPRDVARRSNRGFCFINFHSRRGVGILAALLDEARVASSAQTPRIPEPLQKCQLYYANVQGKGEELRRLIEQRHTLHPHSDADPPQQEQEQEKATAISSRK
jgi:hypothetical protein